MKRRLLALTHDQKFGLITDAFCSTYAVGARDLGIGTFVARESPIRPGRCQGICVFDATNGSLRLTQRLAENFLVVLEAAAFQATQQEREEDRVLFEEFAELVRGMRAMAPERERQSAADDDSNDPLLSG